MCLCLQATYLEFSAAEVRQARAVAARGDDPGLDSGGQDSELSRMLRGGALDVKVVRCPLKHAHDADTMLVTVWRSQLLIAAQRAIVLNVLFGLGRAGTIEEFRECTDVSCSECATNGQQSCLTLAAWGPQLNVITLILEHCHQTRDAVN